MSRKKPTARCARCRMRQELCLCAHIDAQIPILAALRPRPTKISILMHYKEERLSTNTGRLAHLLLKDCDIVLRGQQEPVPTLVPAATPTLSANYRLVLLYPSDTAVELTTDFAKLDTRPIHLVVPDGSWRQASKVAKRETWLAQVPHVLLPQSALFPSRYFLRDEPKAGGLATFEAIARCLGALEGAPLQAALEATFELFVSRTLKSRGAHHPPRHAVE